VFAWLSVRSIRATGPVSQFQRDDSFSCDFVPPPQNTLKIENQFDREMTPQFDEKSYTLCWKYIDLRAVKLVLLKSETVFRLVPNNADKPELNNFPSFTLLQSRGKLRKYFV